MKNTIKFMTIILAVVIVMMTFSSTVFAAPTASEVITNLNNEKNQLADVSKIGGKIVNTITTVGIIAAVVILAILGIKYMVGSTAEKAEYKKTMIPYIIGAVLLLGASSIVSFLSSIDIF